ncbi:hypothetical protein [Curvibacter delicatus]|jgi:hypothetical protein|uniref:hypothetical protein n=1 Tax=Curvibacter delicatus TaxID=80879 RepID=UPI00082D40E8|nr:hypothetical protein [Curvibacter delicatus]
MSDLLFDQFLLPFFVRFFFVFSLIGLATGAGLVFFPGRMREVFEQGNRWLSVRRHMKWLEVPYDIDTALYRFARQLGGVLIALAVYSTFVLATQVNAAGLVSAMGADKTGDPMLALIVADTVRWSLVAGGVLGIVVMLLVLFSPNLMGGIEKPADRWYSTRNWLRGLDQMRMGFDTWVQGHPRAMGSLMLLGSLVVSLHFGIRWFVQG